jgi:hypothetical protein
VSETVTECDADERALNDSSTEMEFDVECEAVEREERIVAFSSEDSEERSRGLITTKSIENNYEN